jgi:hypothetical protein
VQRELRHRRARPRQRVDHSDGLRGSHADRWRSAETKRALGETKRRTVLWSRSEEQGATNAKCWGNGFPSPPLIYRSRGTAFPEPRGRAPRTLIVGDCARHRQAGPTTSKQRTRTIIAARQPKSHDGPSRPPAHVAHYKRDSVT